MTNQEKRAEFFNSALDAVGVDKYGRGRQIVKDLSVSPATAQAWQKGSLPKDAPLLIKASEYYGFTAKEWVNGERELEKPSYNEVHLAECVKTICQFQIDKERQLTGDQFYRILSMLLTDEAQGLQFLAMLPAFISDMEGTAGNGIK